MRAAFYIDGFNLYHSIVDLREPCLKWLNLWSLAASLVPQKSERVVKVVFCTAYFPGDEKKRWRHEQYLQALRNTSVEIVMGHYVHEPANCRNCGHEWQKPSEKQTDINVALSLYKDAVHDIYDIAYLVTADSDQAATARFFRESFPSKQLVTVAPPGREFSNNIKQFAHRKLKISRESLVRNLFPALVPDPLGQARAARRPTEYDPLQ